MPISRWSLLILVVLALPLAKPAGAAPPQADALTPAQAQQMIDLLQDPGKREELLGRLRALAKAAPPAPAHRPAELPPHSLGAQLLLQLSQWTQELFRQSAETARAATQAPALWRRSRDRLADPVSRAELADALAQIALVLGCALLGGWLADRASRRAVRALECRAPIGVAAEPGLRGGAAPLVARLPFALARLPLDLFPVAIIAALGNGLPATVVAASEPVRLMLLAIVNAVALCGAIVAAARMLISPARPRLRLLQVDDAVALCLYRWVRRLVVVGVFGASLAETALLLGLPAADERALLRLVALVLDLLLVTLVLQCRDGVARRLRAPAGARGAIAGWRDWFAQYWHYIAISLIVAGWFAWAISGASGFSEVLRLAIVAAVVLVLARLAAILALGLLDRASRLDPERAQRFPGLDLRLQHYHALSRRVVSAAIGALAIVALLQAWGVDAALWFRRGHLGARLLSALIAIALAAVAAALAWEIANATIERRLRRLAQEAPAERLARVQTLLPMLRTALLVAILAVLGLTVLSELGIDIAPLLTGAGIIGLAIGFGAQKLMQDVITGLFLLSENALRVGDAVTVSGLSGTVENLSIRNIWLRAPDGAVNIIPFSSVTSITNTSRGMGSTAISVTVGYDEDIERVRQVLQQVVAEMRDDPALAGSVRGDLQILGVDKVSAQGVTIAGQIASTDTARAKVQREFNLRVIQRFRALGIAIGTA